MALGWSSLAAALLVVWVFFPWNKLAARLLPDGKREGMGFQGREDFSLTKTSARNSCRRFTKAICFTCRRPSPAFRRPRRAKILQITDRIIQPFPEVQNVFGKVGRAETATDPAPMDMIETTIMLKPEEEWPAVDIKDDDGKIIAHRRRTPDELADAMNAAVQIPGLNNAWTMPIKTRIDMLATGIKTPVGIKIAGPDLAELERIGLRGRGGGQSACPAPPAPLPSARWAETTSSSTLTATPSPATA